MPPYHTICTRRWLVAGMLVLQACSSGGTATTPPPPPPPPPPPLVLAVGSPSGNNQTGVVSQALSAPLRVLGTRGGDPAADEPVTWSSSAGQIVGSGPTGANGTATATWTLGPVAGAQTATATSGNQTVQFGATATAPPADNLAIALAQPSGNNQTAVVGSTLPEALRVVVTNNGTPDQGVIVIWQTPSPNGFFNPPQSLTSAQGIATSQWTLGTTLGTHTATATAGQAGGPNVAFAAIATQGPGGGTVNVALSLAGGGQFNPANVVIAAGTTVRWTWTDSPHTVTSTGTPTFPDHAAQANAPTVYEHTFTIAGNYAYFCTVHGSPNSGMRGTVVVQ